MKIKEVIVVEGKNDANVLHSYFECETIITHGTSIDEHTLQQIEQAKNKRGVIIFTDPDYPGEYIRKTINQRISGCKNAYIEKCKAKTEKKVGIEHASKADLEEALAHMFTYDEDVQTLTWEDYCSFGFQGRANSAVLRERIAKQLYLGKPNAKTLFKRLNMLHMTATDIMHLLDDDQEKGSCNEETNCNTI